MILVLAALGEIVELLTGAYGCEQDGRQQARRRNGTGGFYRRRHPGSLDRVPVPLIGSAVSAVFFAGLGAMAGAILGEISVGQRLVASWRIGKAAFWARLAGTLGKMLLGAVMIIVVVAAMLL